jgi:hypothetical protein
MCIVLEPAKKIVSVLRERETKKFMNIQYLTSITKEFYNLTFRGFRSSVILCHVIG